MPQTYIAYSFREKLLENIYTFFKKFHLKTYSYSYLLCVRILSWKKMVDFFDGRSSLRNMPVQSAKFFVFSIQTLQWNYLKKSVYFMSLELIVGESMYPYIPLRGKGVYRFFFCAKFDASTQRSTILVVLLFYTDN